MKDHIGAALCIVCMVAAFLSGLLISDEKVAYAVGISFGVIPMVAAFGTLFGGRQQ